MATEKIYDFLETMKKKFGEEPIPPGLFKSYVCAFFNIHASASIQDKMNFMQTMKLIQATNRGWIISKQIKKEVFK